MLDRDRYLKDPAYHEAVELVRQSLAAELHASVEDVPAGDLDAWSEVIERLAAARTLESIVTAVRPVLVTTWNVVFPVVKRVAEDLERAGLL